MGEPQGTLKTKTTCLKLYPNKTSKMYKDTSTRILYYETLKAEAIVGHLDYWWVILGEKLQGGDIPPSPPPPTSV